MPPQHVEKKRRMENPRNKQLAGGRAIEFGVGETGRWGWGGTGNRKLLARLRAKKIGERDRLWGG